MSKVTIKFENVSKMYQLGQIGTGTLSHDLNRWWNVNMLRKEDPYLKIGSVNDRSAKADSDYVWALRDINFDINQGDILGIIGKNGAGKSTLLKILSRVTAPTTGCFKVKGRIASLLEVGTGFHAEMTGRENIYMNGAIMGMTKAEITSRFDEIVDFAGVERYIDTPVKRYSSGMTVRLGFAIAAHLEPEILVVDEVLAVGDAEFQKKAIGKMQDVSKGEGRTVLFVSHNMNSIKNLCNKGLLLNNGEIEYQGGINDTIKRYLSVFHNKDLISFVSYNINNSELQILEAKLIDTNGNIIDSAINTNTDFFVFIKYKFAKPMSKIHLTLVIGTENGEVIMFCDRVDYYESFASVNKGIYETVIKFPNPLLLAGKYSVTLGCSNMESCVEDHKFDVLSFEISDSNLFRTTPRNAYVFQPLKWELNKIT